MTQWQPLASIAALQRRAQRLRSIRDFFTERGVLEVQTPLLGTHSVTDPDVASLTVDRTAGSAPRYLQTSPEYFMKRLLAAGMPSCYQLAAAFRRDEVGRLHNAEFTMLEWYRIDFDHHQLMAEVADLVALILGPGTVATRTYASLVGDLSRPRAELDLAFADACAQLTGRVFVVDYPADQAALARLNTTDPTTAARFELVVDGVEIANGYWELKDPEVHHRRVLEDQRVRAARGLSSPEPDPNFLAAIEHGLPDCAGVALGLDRLFMLAEESRDIESVLAFR